MKLNRIGDDLWRLKRKGEKFGVVLADPPWRFETWSMGSWRQPRGDRAAPYEVMQTEDFLKLEVEPICADDCALLLWCVNSMPADAMNVISAWGFEFKTVAFTWAKTTETLSDWHFGMGYWTRQNTERCLLATRGKPKRLNADVPELLVDRVREHSRKPDRQYKRIERLLGGPYLELFARQRRKGWTCIGDQLDRFS